MARAGDFRCATVRGARRGPDRGTAATCGARAPRAAARARASTPGLGVAGRAAASEPERYGRARSPAYQPDRKRRARHETHLRKEGRSPEMHLRRKGRFCGRFHAYRKRRPFRGCPSASGAGVHAHEATQSREGRVPTRHGRGPGRGGCFALWGQPAGESVATPCSARRGLAGGERRWQTRGPPPICEACVLDVGTWG